jgi:hypothetical protein
MFHANLLEQLAPAQAARSQVNVRGSVGHG